MNLPSHSGKHLSCLAFLLLAGFGCSSLPRTAPAEGGFHLTGKMGLVYGDESFSARFLWRQQGRRFTIDLWGPLGQGRVQLTGVPRHLALREGDGTLISDGPPETVMTHHLGWSLPLGVLPQWVRGRPADGRPVADRTLDDAGQLASFRQIGWLVTLERYRPVPEGSAAGDAASDAQTVLLPHRITAERDGYRVRLAVSKWQI